MQEIVLLLQQDDIDMIVAKLHSRPGTAGRGPEVSGNTQQRSRWRFLCVSGCIRLWGRRSIHREAAQRGPHCRHSRICLWTRGKGLCPALLRHQPESDPSGSGEDREAYYVKINIILLFDGCTSSFSCFFFYLSLSNSSIFGSSLNYVGEFRQRIWPLFLCGWVKA